MRRCSKGQNIQLGSHPVGHGCGRPVAGGRDLAAAIIQVATNAANDDASSTPSESVAPKRKRKELAGHHAAAGCAVDNEILTTTSRRLAGQQSGVRQRPHVMTALEMAPEALTDVKKGNG
jgi:hypothetical protein